MVPDTFYSRMIEDIEDYAILFLNTEGNIESWNKGAEKIKGYNREEILGRNFKLFYTEEDQQNGLPQQLIREATANGKAVYEGWRVRKDKTRFWGSIVATAVYDEDKKLIGFTKVTRDLTDKKLAEESLHEFNKRLEQKVAEQNAELYKNEKRFRALVENNYEAISLRNAKGEMIYHSPGAEKITGYSAEDMQRMSGPQFFHPDDIAAVNERMAACMQKPGIPIYGVHRVQHKDGHYIWLEGTVTNMLDDEHVQALVGNFRDITERKNNEEKIMQANRLYAYVSAINQTIVHVTDKDVLYNEACRIAIEIGKFAMAWIAIPNKVAKSTHVVAHSNTTAADIAFLESEPYDILGAKNSTLEKGDFFAVNDLETEAPEPVREYVRSKGFRSFISLPIVKQNVTVGSLNLSSVHVDSFDDQEIKLLKEVVGDISFALEVFDKEKKRNAAEEKTIHSELRLKHAQAIAHLGSWELDLTTGVGIWSEETCRIYGLDLEDNKQTYEQWLSFVHPADKDYVIKHQQEAMAARRNLAFFHRIIRRDGTTRHIHAQAEIEYKDGVPTALYGIAHDVTNMKLVEEALQRFNNNIGMIMDLVPQPISVKDYYGRFVFVNKNFSEIYGLRPDEMLGKTIGETIPQLNDPLDFMTRDKDVIDTGQTTVIPELIFNDISGRQRIFRSVKVPYNLPETNEKAILSISQDITDQKRIEAERTKMVADIIQRNKDLEQFSYIVSHNLRAPVANIIGLADLFTLMYNDEDDQKMIMQDLATSVKKLDDVIKDLNNILQMRNQVAEHNEPIVFSSLLADIELSIRTLLKNEDVKIISDFTAIDEMFSIKSFLYSIFSNLISNSVRYRRQGIQPLIQISSSQDEHGITLIFRDNGLGIDLKKNGEYVFGLYKRFHHHVEGKGLGLYLVKNQVETLGGKISVESELNHGTTFKIVFTNK